MAETFDQVITVLYDYKYDDDAGEVTIKKGDVYRLVEKTNNEWWQVYDPSDADGESFFVPAQYVEIVPETSPLKAISDLDKTLTFGSDGADSPTPDYSDDSLDPPYSTVANAYSGFLPVGNDRVSYVNTSSSPSGSNVDSRVSYVNTSSVQDHGGGEYCNLDLYRSAAGIPTQPNDKTEAHSSKQSTNVPPELIQGTVPPPLPENGTYIKVLLEGLPWDIYKEHTAGRLYYVNRETGERMWKPPRKPVPQQTLARTPEEPLSGQSSPTSAKEEEWNGLPPGYEQITDNGNIYFIHKGTQEKWKSLVDKIGRKYFHKLGSPDTHWNLPLTSALNTNVDVKDVDQRVQSREKDVNWESQGHRLSTFGGPVPSRQSRASSTYGQLEYATPPSGNRASTLPANFTVARPAPLAQDRLTPTGTLPLSGPAGAITPSPPSSARPTLPPQEEVLEGYVNKAKILDTGKKKVKKNWTQTYLKLRGCNLIFYKDQKSAMHDGKNEGVVSLQGAHINFNPPKDLTSRKNSILLQVSSGSMFLFQSDNEKIIREWFTRMKIVANDVSPVSESSPISFDVKDEKKDDRKEKSFKEDKKEKATTKSVSSEDSVSLQGVDRNRNMVGIRAKLLSLISRRPTQEDLYKRGIIKDAVFGSRLAELCDREKTHVPKFVHNCIAAVESKGLHHDGLYRVSGNMAEIQRLRCAVDKDESYNLYDPQWDVNVLTGSLKLFFRELKEPLFPFNNYNSFIHAISKETAKEKSVAFKKAIGDLPRCNYYTLKELIHHLCKVIDKSQINRMQVQNVAIVFGPTLMWQQEEGGSLAVSTMNQSKIVEYVLLEYVQLFKH